jgi:hypothetical protein
MQTNLHCTSIFVFVSVNVLKFVLSRARAHTHTHTHTQTHKHTDFAGAASNVQEGTSLVSLGGLLHCHLSLVSFSLPLLYCCFTVALLLLYYCFTRRNIDRISWASSSLSSFSGLLVFYFFPCFFCCFFSPPSVQSQS